MTRLHTAALFPALLRDRTLRSDSGSDSAATSGAASVSGGGNTVTGSAPSGSDTVGSAQAGPDWAEFTRGLSQLNESLAPRLDALRSDVQAMPNALRPEPPPPAAPDWDSMTQADLAAHLTQSILGAVESSIAKSLEPVMARVNDTQQSQFKSTVESEMKDLSATNKDFADWKPEMVALARAHPTLGLADLYKLAKVNNPTKAVELDTRYNPKPPPPTRWGGLTPALGGSNGSAKPVSREEAGRSAYAEVSSRHPGILAALENL